MDIGSFIFWGIIVSVLIYAIILYNNLVRLKHNVSKSWSNIDVLLKQRHDELPKLVETCKQYMKHERETLQAVILARNNIQQARDHENVKEVGAAETEMRSGLNKLFAVAESYPDLKANENFQHLQARITGLENSIADRREFYNDSVNINNTRIEQFPDVIIARIFNFGMRDLLQFSEAETADVNVKDLFS